MDIFGWPKTLEKRPSLVHKVQRELKKNNISKQQYNHWRRTKVETTGATQDYETFFETFLDFETKKQVVPWHQWHHLVWRH